MRTLNRNTAAQPSGMLMFVCVAVLAVSCAGRTEIRTTADDPTRADVAQLWVDPRDLESRDLFHGPGGRDQAPDPAAPFELLAVDDSGYSRGYDVRDRNGMKWSVKLGIEAQPEVVTSRVLWAMGYHQPDSYLVTSWQLTGTQAGPQGMARFRREPENHKVVGEWSWYENPFIGTREFQGLLVANVLLNNWDWKTSNNKIYDIVNDQGAGYRRYVVRDLGASLGKTSFPQFLKWTPMRGMGQGSRNDVADFEEQGFIKGVEGDRVKFDYRGIHQRLVDTITVQDVVWACRLLARVSDQQWRDAFRAGGYQESDQVRFITKVKAKIQEGLALAGTSE